MIGALSLLGATATVAAKAITAKQVVAIIVSTGRIIGSVASVKNSIENMTKKR